MTARPKGQGEAVFGLLQDRVDTAHVLEERLQDPLVEGERLGEIRRGARPVALGQGPDDAHLVEVKEHLCLHVEGGPLVKPALRGR